MTRATNNSATPSSRPATLPRTFVSASAIAIAFYVIAGLFEATLIRVLQPSELELDWISDGLLSTALGVAVYLWLYLRATRRALTESERAQLVIQAQLSLAEAMQRRLLPPVPAPADGLDWAAVLIPAGRIGGDFFDFLGPRPGVRLMLIADVSGKGISAAMALTLLRSTFRRVARDTVSPAELASRMSDALLDEWHGSPYVTAIVAQIDTMSRTLTYTNAGHPKAILVRDGTSSELAEGGPPLGLLNGARFNEGTLTLLPGDVCVLVTDGISEAFDDELRPWDSTLLELLRKAPQSAEQLCAALISEAQEGPGPRGVDDWTDDRTVIVLEVSRPNETARAARSVGPGDSAIDVRDDS